MRILSIYTDNFETIFGTKSNIQALRNKVLNLAVRGKLVAQDPNDEPASSLIKNNLNQDVQPLKILKDITKLSLNPVSGDDIPFELPASWIWVRVGAIAELISGKDEPVSECNDHCEGIPYIMGASNIEKGLFTPERWISIPKTISKVGDIIITVKGTVGKFFVNNYGDINLSRQTMALRLHSQEILDYTTVWLKTYVGELNDKSIGIIPGISREHILESLIPIPPLNEQKHIVAEIKCLMTKIDTLEGTLKKKELLEDLLPKAIVDSIGASKTGEELQNNLMFVTENFENVFQTQESMKDLRSVILQLAIEGKLLPQYDSDEPIVELLNRIAAKKSGLLKKGNSVKRSQYQINNSQIPYEIPKSWGCICLGSLCKKIGAGSTPTGGGKVYKNSGIMFIRSQNVYNDGLRLNNIAYIDETINNKMLGSQVEENDILLNITGASIGRACVVPENFDKANVNQHVIIIRLIDPRMKSFIHLCIISHYIQKIIKDVQVGVSREGLSGEKLSKFIIPIPPLDEQERIVVKVESLMSLIGQMEILLKRKAELIENMASI